MAIRELKGWSDSNVCSTCETPTLATHSTTDSQQQADGSFEETAPRHGCDKHPVAPMVLLLDGSKISFAQYEAKQ